MHNARTTIHGVIAVLVVMASVASASTSTEEVTVRGQYQVIVACYFDQGVSIEEHVLRDDKDKQYTLIFEDEDVEPPEPGSVIEVTGVLKSDEITVRNIDVIEVDAGGNPTTGEQRFCVILFNFQDDQRQNVTPQRVAEVMFDPDDSADAWWRQVSFDRMWSTGDVFGWYTLPVNRGCDPGLWRQLAIEAADDDVYFPDYNRLFLLMPQGGGCGWGGLGTLGMGTFQTDDGPWRTTTAWCRSEYYANLRLAIAITAHEGGHNLGQHHARSIGFAGGPLGPFGCGACGHTQSEYGDRLDALGSWNLGYYSTLRKQRLDWFHDGNVVNVLESGRYALEPYETNSNGLKALRIWRGGAEWVFAEWRQPIGYDTDINWAGGHNYRGLTMHYHWGENGTGTYLPDMTYGDNNWLNAALPYGQTYDDPYTDLAITSVGAQGGVQIVDVSFGAELTAVTARKGTIESGGLEQLAKSDDAYLVAHSKFQSMVSEANILVLRVRGHTRLNRPRWLSVSIEGMLNNPGGAVSLRLRDHDTGRMRRVHSFTMGMNETTEQITGLDARTFVDESGEIELSMKVIVVATFEAAGFEASLDRIEFNTR